jgi:8-hydroxy-5-deazaflavin:NADPH oxidoreductase
MSKSPIAIIGGRGSVGAALARNLVQHGYSVRLAGRDLQATQELAGQLGAKATAVSTQEVAQGAELVVLAVPAAAAVSAIEQAGDLAGKVVIDCTNPLTWNAGPVHAPPPEGSVTAQLAARFPSTRFVKAFNTFGAEFHENARIGGTSADLQMAGDDAQAKGLVAELARALGFEPVDVGPLRNAAHLESLAILWIHLAMAGGQGRNVVFKLLRR